MITYNIIKLLNSKYQLKIYIIILKLLKEQRKVMYLSLILKFMRVIILLKIQNHQFLLNYLNTHLEEKYFKVLYLYVQFLIIVNNIMLKLINP